MEFEGEYPAILTMEEWEEEDISTIYPLFQIWDTDVVVIIVPLLWLHSQAPLVAVRIRLDLQIQAHITSSLKSFWAIVEVRREGDGRAAAQLILMAPKVVMLDPPVVREKGPRRRETSHHASHKPFGDVWTMPPAKIPP